MSQPLGEKLSIVPITRDEANAFIERFHRHHKPPQGYRFAIAVSDGEKIVGVATVGRPVSRARDNGFTLEVTRTCTDGTKNANSMLYGAAWRAARALGYRKLITYTLPTESGVSLRGAGFKVVGQTQDGDKWNRKSRPRVDLHPLCSKLVWEKEAV